MARLNYSQQFTLGFEFNKDGSVLVSNSEHGLGFWSADGKLIAQLIGSVDSDWVMVTPEGLFDGTADARKNISYKIPNKHEPVPVDHFFQDFYRPGLLAEIMAGERPMPDFEMLKLKTPPTLKIVSPKPDLDFDSVTTEIEVECTDSGGGTQGPWLMHNGARVLSSGETLKNGKTLRRSFRLRLVEGNNEFEVKAASSDGSWESESAKITLRYSKPLPKPELYVLAVGINDYSQDSFDLKFAANDATAIGQLFVERGKTLYDKVHLTKLTNQQVTKSEIKLALSKMAKTAQPQDTLVVFLAGHGTMIGQRYYFIPYEFKSKEGQTLQQDIRKQGLAGDVLADSVSAVPALKRLLIFDTCQSGGAVGLASSSRNPFAFRGAIERLSRSQGLFTIAATAASDEAQEVEELGHGVLTYTLLAGLGAVDQGPLMDKPIRQPNQENVAHVLDWFGYASGNVPRLTKKYFGVEQDVQTSGSGSSFPILPVDDN